MFYSIVRHKFSITLFRDSQHGGDGEMYEYVELTKFNECINKRYPNGTLNSDEYDDCIKGLPEETSLEYYQDEEEYNDEMSEEPFVTVEEFIEHKHKQEISSSNRLITFKLSNILIIFFIYTSISKLNI